MNINNFFYNVKHFIQNNKILTMTLGIAGYYVGKLGSKMVVWLRECFGVAKKTDETGRENLNKQSPITNNRLEEQGTIKGVKPTVKQWDLLTTETNKIAGKISYKDTLSVKHRFSNVLCPEKTAVSKDERFIHANYVGKDLCSKNFVASQAPRSDDFSLFWEIIHDKNFTIMDLTTPEEDIKPYYPGELDQSIQYGNFSVQLQKSKEWKWKYEYQVHDTAEMTKSLPKTITRYHFDTWKDYTEGSLSTLSSLVEKLSRIKNQAIWIHCRAGVGRTGTLITAFILKEKIDKKEISLENLDKALIDLIVQLRQERGTKFVQIESQFELLQKYALSLLNA